MLRWTRVAAYPELLNGFFNTVKGMTHGYRRMGVVRTPEMATPETYSDT